MLMPAMTGRRRAWTSRAGAGPSTGGRARSAACRGSSRVIACGSCRCAGRGRPYGGCGLAVHSVKATSATSLAGSGPSPHAGGCGTDLAGFQRLHLLQAASAAACRRSRCRRCGIDERPSASCTPRSSEPKPTRLPGIGIAADHELLAARALQLDPRGRARRRVRAVGALADEAFQALLAGALEQLPHRSVEGLAESHVCRVVALEHRLEQLAALDERHAREIVAAEMRQVEGEVDESWCAPNRSALQAWKSGLPREFITTISRRSASARKRADLVAQGFTSGPVVAVTREEA